METYTTVSGDTWDTIAKAAYKDEMKATHLMKANPGTNNHQKEA